MNRNRIFLHIGPHKTGTSAIQNILYANRTNLAKHGIIYYPLSGCVYGGHHNLAWDILQDQRLEAKHGSWDQLLPELSSLGRSMPVLLSSEDFSLIPAPSFDRVFDALGEYQPTLLYVYRPLRDFLRSLHAEEVKNGMTTLSLNDFIGEKIGHDQRIRIDRHMRALIDAYDMDIKIIPYSSNVLPDVMTYLGVPGAKKLKTRANTRLSTMQLRHILGHRRNHPALDWHTYFYRHIAPYLADEEMLDVDPARESDFLLRGSLADELDKLDKRNLAFFESQPVIDFGRDARHTLQPA